MQELSFGSVCSGIEAASVAWEPLGLKPAWFSEIDSFPSAVLAHRFPDVPNLGDLKGIKRKIEDGVVCAPDILVGGTPCQAFSVAGLRAGLSDERGSLSLSFIELADAIDNQRLINGKSPAAILWENVPGVLSTKDNAFGCFLAGLCGEDLPLIPPREGWTDAGRVHGPKRSIAWRVLDAQYFGVAQRRRRVFVCAVGNPSNVRPDKVLFEYEGARLDASPRIRKPEALASKGSESNSGNKEAIAIQGNVIGRKPGNGPQGRGYSTDGVCFTLNCTDRPAVVSPSGRSIRRLTPVEHERLQGFPDNWTNIPYRGRKKPVDSLRYHVTGNSMAVPVMRWIGTRLSDQLRMSHAPVGRGI